MRLIYWVSFLVLYSGFMLFARYYEKFPTPPPSSKRLFYMQRSNNSNTVIYDANILKNNTIDASNPVHTYWIRYAERGQQEELSYVQRTLAYGLHFKERKNKTELFEGHFFAYKKRKFLVGLDAQNKPVAYFPINGKLQILERVWVQVEEAGMSPKIPYIELFGRDTQTGAKVYEKFKP